MLDVLGDQVVLMVPGGYDRKVRAAIAEAKASAQRPSPPPSLAPQVPVVPMEPNQVVEPSPHLLPESRPVASVMEVSHAIFDPNTLPKRDPNTIRGVLQPFAQVRAQDKTTKTAPLELPDGDDVLDMNLPEQMDLINLLDLVGEYLDLDYVYDSAKIRNQPVTLRLHGQRGGQIRIQDLYNLLETSLKFKGLAMVRQEGNLVSIVPVVEALEADPTLVTAEKARLHAGDMVVTRVFELQHVDVTSVTSLLETMKLSVAITPITETQTLFVTCYAHRMPRIEELVAMVDRPGQSKEFRYRQLQYTMAGHLATKVQALAAELQDVTVKVTTTHPKPKPGMVAPPRPQASAATAASPGAVYLDTDDRTNRLLMIGAPSSLDLVEQLIDILDVAQQDLRTMRVYSIQHQEAEIAAEKLSQLGILGGPQPRRKQKPYRLVKPRSKIPWTKHRKSWSLRPPTPC